MKFSDGFWHMRTGVDARYAAEVYDITQRQDGLVVTAPTKVVTRRGDTLNLPVLTVSVSAPIENVLRVRITHHGGGREPVRFDVARDFAGGQVKVDDTGGHITSGSLEAHIRGGSPWNLTFTGAGQVLTASGHRSVGLMRVAPDAAVDGGPAGLRSKDATTTYLHEQLQLGVGEAVFGLGERFGPLAKNGQTVDIWNSDGGTSSEQAYKNVPFYLTNRGYGILVNDPGHVSFEVGSEAVERVQFSVEGETLEYFVIYGPEPKAVLERYTALTGRPVTVPAWSYGLWLSTSFTTDYDEQTVASFVDAMAQRDLPISVFHFDCFWMREFQWCDLEWDPRVFPDPDGMLSRLRERGLRICVWINPYIAQNSALFAEGMAAGYLVTRPDGTVWQTDRWQAGMGYVDFTNPDATRWYQDKLRRLIDQGVDCFKTDFGERIPVDVVYHDGADPHRMHNYYALLYNRAVFEVLEEARGRSDAVLFARSTTAGGQSLPVHWGGDSTSTYASMAETLRGGLSLAFSGFAFWSHDIGGFEGTPDAGVFKRWTQFGLLSSHSRLHGSDSYRVPWMFDEEAVEVTRRFTKLKLALMPYLYAAGVEAARTGVPMMRPMLLEFPDDPAVTYLDQQYLLGAELLVAPVFDADGEVRFYLPPGQWTHYLSGDEVAGGGWRSERHGFDSLPLYVRPGAVIPVSTRDDRPDHDYLDSLILDVFPAEDDVRTVTVTAPDGTSAEFVVTVSGGGVAARGPADRRWGLRRSGRGEVIAARDGAAHFPPSSSSA